MRFFLDNNDVLRRIRYIFDFNDFQMIEIFALINLDLKRSTITNFLKKEDDVNFLRCTDIILATFLDGLIISKRGKKEGVVIRPEKKLNNNIILRKLKIALNLKNEDMIEIFKLAEMNVSKNELTAFFRKKGHKHFKSCGDQILRNFLKGLQLKFR